MEILVMLKGAFFVLGSFFAMTLSATVGFGGSLLLVPVMLLFFPPVAAIAIAALGLGINSVGKFAIYRKDIPWKQSLPLALIASLVGAASTLLLLSIPPEMAITAIVGVLILSVIGEFIPLPEPASRIGAYLGIAIASISSGISGTSGPTKGLALRSLQLPKEKMVAASTLVSMFGDLSKVVVFFSSGLYQDYPGVVLVLCFISPLACATGFFVNRKATEKGFRVLFWAVVLGYAARLFGELGLN